MPRGGVGGPCLLAAQASRLPLPASAVVATQEYPPCEPGPDGHRVPVCSGMPRGL